MHILPDALFVWAFCTHFGSVLAYVARQDPPADSLAAAPSFSFNSIAEMLTCEPATITWLYSPTSSDVILGLTLAITNNGVPQPSAPASTTVGTFPTGTARRDTLTQTITNTTVNPGLHVYTWPSVNVSAGWYIITASLSFTSTIQSQSFYVTNGPDTSCLAGSGAATSPSPSSSASPTSSGDPSAPSLPVDAVSSTKINRGAIAGGVIGGVAVIAAAVAAYFYLRYASASASSTAGGAPAAHRSTRRRQWGGLSSVDSKTNVYPGPSAHRAHVDSVGALDSSVYVIGNVGIDADERNSYYSPSQEKISASPSKANPFADSGRIDEDGVPLDFISPLPGSPVTRNSSTSTSSYMNNNFSRPRSHPTSPYASPTSPTPEAQAPFGTNAQSSSSLNHSDPSTSSYRPSPSPAYPSGTSQMATADSSPGSPSPLPPPRRSSAGVEPSRRTPRKPVPQYNPTDPALASPPPPSALQETDSSSSREGSVRGAQDLPPLSHKASFGADGRAVHYLIPDMPPPQRD